MKPWLIAALTAAAFAALGVVLWVAWLAITAPRM